MSGTRANVPEGLIRKVVIVGGGTSGWLTAGILGAEHSRNSPFRLDITLIESSNITILGVGEGTWPSLRGTLQKIGINENELLIKCHASLKQGTRFIGWGNGNTMDIYYHPFEPPPNEDIVDWLTFWKSRSDVLPFASVVSPQAQICSRNLAPKLRNSSQYEGVSNYGYHLDANAFSQLLQEHCTTQLNISHICDEVMDLQYDHCGFVKKLMLKSGKSIEGDIFVDCTGMRAELISKYASDSIVDLSDTLLNDSALATQVPYSSQEESIRSQTDSTAAKDGWIWDIALQHRRGIGYVFSSNHTNEDGAKQTLKQYINSSSHQKADESQFRLIKFRPHYRQKPWVNNVIAIGMSQGFVEPLEASAIVMIELAAKYLSKAVPPSKSIIDIVAKKFNERFQYRWERIVDFLKFHYILSERTERYWLDQRQIGLKNLRITELLSKWKYVSPSREDFTDALEIFTASSYAYVLYGMQNKTSCFSNNLDRVLKDRLNDIYSEILRRENQLLKALPTNRELLNYLHSKTY